MCLSRMPDNHTASQFHARAARSWLRCASGAQRKRALAAAAAAPSAPYAPCYFSWATRRCSCWLVASSCATTASRRETCRRSGRGDASEHSPAPGLAMPGSHHRAQHPARTSCQLVRSTRLRLQGLHRCRRQLCSRLRVQRPLRRQVGASGSGHISRHAVPLCRCLVAVLRGAAGGGGGVSTGETAGTRLPEGRKPATRRRCGQGAAAAGLAPARPAT